MEFARAQDRVARALRPTRCRPLPEYDRVRTAVGSGGRSDDHAASRQLRVQQRLPTPSIARSRSRGDRRALRWADGTRDGAGWAKDEYDAVEVSFEPGPERAERCYEGKR